LRPTRIREFKMKKVLRKFAILLTVTAILTGCAPYKKVHFNNIQIGMSKKEVNKAVGKKPSNFIGSKKYPDGTVEVLQYNKYDIWHGNLEERFWLYFYNDKIVKWGVPSTDWETEADKIYENRNR